MSRRRRRRQQASEKASALQDCCTAAVWCRPTGAAAWMCSYSTSSSSPASLISPAEFHTKAARFGSKSEQEGSHQHHFAAAAVMSRCPIASKRTSAKSTARHPPILNSCEGSAFRASRSGVGSMTGRCRRGGEPPLAAWQVEQKGIMQVGSLLLFAPHQAQLRMGASQLQLGNQSRCKQLLDSPLPPPPCSACPGPSARRTGRAAPAGGGNKVTQQAVQPGWAILRLQGQLHASLGDRNCGQHGA